MDFSLARIDFNIKEMVSKINEKGYLLKWHKNMLCPCRESMSGRVDMTCDLCKGTGFIYKYSGNFKGLISGIEREAENFSERGHIYKGQARMTYDSSNLLAQRDKVEMVDAVMVYTEMFRAAIKNRLRYNPVEIESIYIDKDEVDPNLIRVDEDQIYRDSQPIPLDSLISVRYTFNPVFIIVQFPHSVRDTMVLNKGIDSYVKGPQKALIQLEFLYEGN